MLLIKKTEKLLILWLIMSKKNNYSELCDSSADSSAESETDINQKPKRCNYMNQNLVKCDGSGNTNPNYHKHRDRKYCPLAKADKKISSKKVALSKTQLG